MKLFPRKEVAQSALVEAIKHKMEVRKHSKLYLPKKHAKKALVNTNPMKVSRGLFNAGKLKYLSCSSFLFCAVQCCPFLPHAVLSMLSLLPDFLPSC